MMPVTCDECDTELEEDDRVLTLKHGRVDDGTVSYGKETLMCQSCTLRQLA